METSKVYSKTLILVLASTILISSCTSTTRIQSIPNGAKVYVDGIPVGRTPYFHTDSKIAGSKTTVRIESEGYEPIDTYFYKDEQVDVGAVIGGLFLWIPFLWVMKYNPDHTYELTPLWADDQLYEAVPGYQNERPVNQPAPSKAERLRELKKLLDEKILTQEEFDKEKQKILDEDNK